ncbi:hypothetical protein Tco_0884282 [Tanacetum coccineum]
MMDDLNITMEEYIRLEEEKARKHGKVFNWETAKYVVHDKSSDRETISPDFDLFSDQEEYSEEEVTETMVETMEQYMSKTRPDYGSGVARLRSRTKNNFELKGQFLKERQMHEVVYFYNGLDVPTRQILDSRGVIPSKTVADAKAIYGRNPKQIYGESAKRHEENSNLIKEIQASMDAAIRNQGASIKTLEIQIRQMSKLMQARYAVLDHTNTPRLNDCYCEDKKGSYGPKFSKAYSCEASHIDKSIPRKEKDPGSFTLPCYINNVCFDNALADLGASVSVMPLLTYLNLEARLMGETLVLNRSLDIFFEDYIELNDLNVPLELRRDQVDDLMPTIEEGEVVEEFRARNDARMVSKIFGYPNFAVLEDMDAYRDEGMGDVIFGEPFLREVRINARRFEGMITIYNGGLELGPVSPRSEDGEE